jgi:NCS1 family nucleobase:cation symporter-1
MPWKLLANPEAYIFNWLVGYGGLLGPIAGIMVVDYWLVRGRTLDVPDLYRPRGRYRGTNGVALLALALGVAPNVVSFLRSVKLMGGGPDLWDHIYPYSWFTGFVVAAIIYRQGMRGSRFGFADR